MNRICRSIVVLAAMSVGIAVAAAESPSTGPTPSTSPADRAPSSFQFSRPDDQLKREWTRLDETHWEEKVGGRKIRYVLVEFNHDPKDPGLILNRLPAGDIQVFMPTLDNPDKRLGWRYPPGKEPKNAPAKSGGDWYTLGEMQDAH